MGSVFKEYTRVYSGYRLSTRPAHYGTDLHPVTKDNVKLNDGIKVLSCCAGEVMYAGWSTAGWGNLVKIKSANNYFYYAHLASVDVKKGVIVEEGAILGVMGSTGNSTGPHVHFEVRDLSDARPFGCVDPSPFCAVTNVNGTVHKPSVPGVNAYDYKMREYVDSGEIMTLEEFYKAKDDTPNELLGVGLTEDKKIKIARVVSASETYMALGKKLPAKHYLY